MARDYFAALNSSEGFINLFPVIFSRKSFRYVFIIKGGPGTGKSTLMRRIAEHFARHGCDVDRILCSSDPDSLDGVIINKAVAVIDGTPPHLEEVQLPCAADEAVTLYYAMDRAALMEKREEIENYINIKKKGYDTAYGHFRNAGRILQLRDGILSEYINREEIYKLAKRLSRGAKRGKMIPITVRAFSGKGETELETLASDAEPMLIKNPRGAGEYAVRVISGILSRENVEYLGSICHLAPEYCDRLSLCGKYIKPCSEGRDIMRYYDRRGIKAVKNRLTLLEKLIACNKKAGLDALHECALAHEKLEEIYRSNTDFEKVDRVYADLICKITSIL